MKKNLSFLFLFILVYHAFAGVVAAQQLTDSTAYYYKRMIQPSTNSDLAKAYFYFDKSTMVHLKNKDISAAITDLIYSAGAQYKLGAFYESEKTLIQALELSDQLGIEKTDPISRISIYNQLGMIYEEQGNFSKSLEFYNSALDFSASADQRNSIRNNKAIVLINEKKYNHAIEELVKVYQYNLQGDDKVKIARSLDNLGFARSKINDPLALENMREALDIREDINHINGIFTSYYHLSKYFKERDPEQSLDFANKAYTISKNTNNVNQKEAALELLVELKNDPDLVEYAYIKDSIADFQKRSRDQYAALKYEKESEIKRADISQLKMERWIIFSVILGLLFVLIYYFQRTKHTREKQQKVYETESRISKRIHDELANDVYGAMIQLENKSADLPLIINDLEAIYHSARDISQEKSDYNSTDDFVEDLKRMLSSFSNDQTNIIVRGLSTQVWMDISGIKKVATLRVLKELLVNMKKHSEARIVSIVFRRDDKHLHVLYTDDGIGMGANKANKGSGLTNAESRIQAIGGKFIFDRSKEKGSKIDIQIPL